MPTNEQRRQAAKRKLERQLARRAERVKRRRVLAVAGSIVFVLLVVGGIFWLASRDGDGDQTPAAQTSATTTSLAPAETTEGACKFASTPGQPAAKPVELPEDPAEKVTTGAVSVTLKTNNGDIPVTMDRAKAPCTVQSIEHLVKAKFYDGTPCHRIVISDNFKVLQCGDPTGQGTGGPGYNIPDEKPTDLPPAPSAQGASIYPRGAIAMANSGQPNSGGSQFFMVLGSTFLPPDYTIFGTIGEAGLAVLDKIGTEGVDPATDNGQGDGKPKLETTITEAAIAS